MSRALRKLSANGLANSALNVIFTVPAGQKWEVVDATYITDAGVSCQFLALNNGAVTSAFWDDVTVPVGKFGTHQMYSGLVHEAGDQFAIIPIYAGTHNIGVSINYVLVDPA